MVTPVRVMGVFSRSLLAGSIFTMVDTFATFPSSQMQLRTESYSIPVMLPSPGIMVPVTLLVAVSTFTILLPIAMYIYPLAGTM
ncbi:hypothetical protein D3C86_1449940 [compost metagenome]